MAIYEKFVGASRDDFLSLKDAQNNYKLTYPDNFNFAYDVIESYLIVLALSFIRYLLYVF